jgi:hypothetical protein
MKKFIAALMLLAPVTQADTITTDGTLIENQIFYSQVSVKAHNVTIRNCEFYLSHDSTDGWYAVTNVYNNADGTPKSTNFRLENCIVRGGPVGVYVQHATVIGCDVQESGKDAFKIGSGGHCMIRNNYVARIGLTVGAHADALQSVGGSHVFIIGNHFDIPVSFADENGYLSNACIILQSQVKEIHDWYIWGNHFEGGSYTVYIKDKDHPNYPGIQPPYRIRMNANTFGTDYRYGIASIDMAPTIQINFNRWDDGTPMDTGQWDINTWDMWPNW